MNPNDQEIRSKEREACYHYNKLSTNAKSFFKQRSRVQWLKLGDKNTTFFYRSLLHRRARNHIHSFTSDTGEVVREPVAMGNMAATYFQTLISDPNISTDNRSENTMYTKTISREDREAMAIPVTREEIRDALFSIPDDKAPGTDGYNSYFFKTSWETVGNDFAAAVGHFFRTTSMPRCI